MPSGLGKDSRKQSPIPPERTMRTQTCFIATSSPLKAVQSRKRLLVTQIAKIGRVKRTVGDVGHVLALPVATALVVQSLADTVAEAPRFGIDEQRGAAAEVVIGRGVFRGCVARIQEFGGPLG